MYYHICKHEEESCRPQAPAKDKKCVEALDNSEIYEIVNKVYEDEE